MAIYDRSRKIGQDADIEGAGPGYVDDGKEEEIFGSNVAPIDTTPFEADVVRTSDNGGLAPDTNQVQARNQQQALIDKFHGLATGRIKSPAQEMFEQQVQQAQQRNRGQSASLRDAGPGGQGQIAQQNAEMIQGRGNEQGAIIKQQQMQQAEKALTGLYAQMRSGDLDQAGLAAQNSLGVSNLDDLYNMNNAQMNYNNDMLSTDLQEDAANASLGFGVEEGAQQTAMLNSVVGATAAGFGYLGKAAEDEDEDEDKKKKKPDYDV